jgi:hypothetical protein
MFPLKLAAFERYLLTDDRPGYPMNFFVRMKFQGVFHRTALESAVGMALIRHPLLQAIVQPADRDRYNWTAAERPEVRVVWRSEGSLPVCSAIDIANEVGVRIYVARGTDRCEMFVQFHHVCCDGLGAMRFVEDVLAAYHGILEDGQATLHRPLESCALGRRDKFVGGLWQAVARAPKELLGLLGVLEYFAHRPVPLAVPPSGPCSDDHLAAAYPACCSHTFSRFQTTFLRQAAKRLDCTTNDLLLWGLFLAIYDWTLQYHPQNRRGPFRIMIPTSLRGAGDEGMPAANRVAMVFLDRRPHKYARSRALLKSVRWEMKIIKQCRMGLTFLHAIRSLGRFPGGLRRMLPTSRCLATTMLTNLLDPTVHFRLPRRDGRVVAGNVVLDGIEGYAPVRPQTHATFATVFYAGQLSVGMLFDGQHLEASQAAELLDLLVQRLLHPLGPTPSQEALRGGAVPNACPSETRS